MAGSGEWYWCLKHGRAEEAGEACRAEDRLGPYESREAAEHWRDRFEERERAWRADRDEDDD